MEKVFKTCDRCGAQVYDEKDYEITINIVSEETGTPKFKEVDLCNECRNSLVHWFGSQNPYTRKEFIYYL